MPHLMPLCLLPGLVEWEVPAKKHGIVKTKVMETDEI